MAAAEGSNNIMRYTYRGEEDEIIPEGATHITMSEDVGTSILLDAFSGNENIVEIIFHEDVEKIEELQAFCFMCSLRRVIMPGVKIAGGSAFDNCIALTDVECGQLETIKVHAFGNCESLRGINLPSARIVERGAFRYCYAMKEVKFGRKLERLEKMLFESCGSLERITIPLKDGIIIDDNVFIGCRSLNQVDLVEGELHETIAYLHSEEWINDMNEEIDSINHILPNARAGRVYFDNGLYADYGQKARAIRRWIRSVLRKIIYYQAEHQQVLNVAETTLKLALPRDIVNRSVLPFLELPSHTFELAEGGDEDEDESSYSEGSSSEGEESELEEEVNDDDEASSKRRRIEIE